MQREGGASTSCPNQSLFTLNGLSPSPDISLLSRSQLGAWGEDFAEHILTKQAYKIIARNWRRNLGELDIVCYRERVLVFVEVKTRKWNSKAFPLHEAISREKEHRLYALAGMYRREERSALRSYPYSHCRFDLFAIATHEPPRPYFRHYENFFAKSGSSNI